MTVAIVSLLSLSSGAGAQRTWLVDSLNGSGTDFRDIQSAVNAARANDLILVRTGIGGRYQGFTVSKGLTIMCEQRGGAFGVVDSDVNVRQIPYGERFVLKRCIGIGTSSLLLENNAGTVFVEKCQHGLQGGRLLIRNCSTVALNEVVAIDARIESSYVTMNRGLSDFDFPQDPLLFISSSVVVFGNTILRGSRANYSMTLCQVLVPPGEAIAGYDSLLILGAGTSILGGSLNVSGGSCPPVSIQAAAIRGSNIRVIKDPAATLGIVTGNVALQTTPQPTLDGMVGDEQAGRMDFDLWGAPGSAAALVASLPADPLVTSLGFQWANLAAYVVPDVGLVDATGHRKVSFTFPTAYPLGHAMVFQSLVVDTSGMRWSTPSVIVRN